MAQAREKSLFTEFIETTTIHGIRYVFCGESKLRRSIWLLFVLSATLIFIYSIANLVRPYRDKEVVTRARVVFEDDIAFPAVTFCNFNYVRKSYLDKLSQNHPYAAWLLNQYYDKELIINYNDTYLEYLLANFTFTNNFFLDGSHKLDKMLVNCTLKGEKCVPADFDQIVTNMGVCYTFNAGEFFCFEMKYDLDALHGFNLLRESDEKCWSH